MTSDGSPISLRAQIFERDRMMCRYCGREVLAGSPGLRRATIDHVIPISRFHRANGGPGRGQANTLENMVTACYLCNNTKNDRTPDEAGMTLRPVPDGSWQPPKVVQARPAKTGTRHGVAAPPPRLSYRIRLPERDAQGNFFLGPEHTVYPT